MRSPGFVAVTRLQYRAFFVFSAPGFVAIFHIFVTVVLQRVEAAARLGDSQRLASFVAFQRLELSKGLVAVSSRRLAACADK